MSGIQVASPVRYEPRPPSRSSRPPSRSSQSPRPGSRGSQSPRPGSRGSQSPRSGFQSSGHSSGLSREASPQMATAPAYPRESPPSVRSLREKKELSAYLAPMVKTAVRRWKRFHEQRVLERFKERKETKKKKVESLREEKQRLARKVPVDTLALQWLNTNQVTVDTRAYLLDKLLPTLILGIEKLLTEAERKGLTERNESSPDFNPINYLAQYLMRNNPRYSNFPEASPYIRGLREVTEELKKHVFSFEDNRLAKIKSEARKRREEVERQLAKRDRERGRRSARVRKQFTEWLLEEHETVEMQFIQTALKSFQEVVETTHEDVLNVSIVTNIMSELEDIEKSEEKLSGEEFVKMMRSYFADLPTDLFDELMTHMSNCAASYRQAAILEARRELLSEIFEKCDHSGVGLLDRHRVLNLFEHFWDEAAYAIKKHLRNPRKWPVVELDETDETDSMTSSEGSRLSQSPQVGPLEATKPPEQDLSMDNGRDSIQDAAVTGEAGAMSTPVLRGGEEVENAEADTEKSEVVGEGRSGTVPEGNTLTDGEAEVVEGRAPIVDSEGATAVVDGETALTAHEGAAMTEESPETGGVTAEEAAGIPEGASGEALGPAKGEQDGIPTTAGGETGGQPFGVAPPLTAADRPASVSFDEEAIRRKENVSHSLSRLAVKTPLTNRSGSIAASAFDENFLNQSQFIQLVEVFLRDDATQHVIDALVEYLRSGYVETEEEKFLRLQKARKEAQSAKRRLLFEQLFEKWDNDGSGYLDFDELMGVISKFKENMESKLIIKAKSKIADSLVDNRISQHDFKIFINELCSLLPGGEDNFDPIIDFLMTSIERSYEERIRGQARKKWLTQIIRSAWTSGANMTPVFKSLFNSLYKDAEQHGRGKRISANVSLLEKNDGAPQRGTTLLKYVAATPDDAHLLLNKCLYRDMKGISFASVDSGKPIHVPRVQNHGNIMFWNPERSDEERQGSFMVIPLKDFKKRVFGVLGIDTLSDMQEKSIFITHEISFFQGVAKAFSQSYQYVDVRRKTLRITESAIAWIHRRSPHVEEISVYLVEPDEKAFDRKADRRGPIKNKKMLEIFVDNNVKVDDSVLRKMMSSNKSGEISLVDTPVRMSRKENLFRDYLFKCMDNSETVTADAYGQRHTAFPLRDPNGVAVVVIDINIGDHKQLPNHENKEVQRMLKLLQAAHRELSTETEGGEKKLVLEAEKRSEESRIDIMFDRIMLTDLRDTVGKLTTRAFAELKSYKDPPKVIHDIVGSVLHLFYQDKEEDLEVWHTCKQYVNPDLVKKIQEFDPTASNALGAVEKIAWRLKDVPHGAVAKHGSLPAQHLYNWAFVCLSLLEHTSKSLGASKGGAVTPVGSVRSDGPPIEQ